DRIDVRIHRPCDNIARPERVAVALDEAHDGVTVRLTRSGTSTFGAIRRNAFVRSEDREERTAAAYPIGGAHRMFPGTSNVSKAACACRTCSAPSASVSSRWPGMSASTCKVARRATLRRSSTTFESGLDKIST